MEIKSDTEPGQELLSQKSSHETSDDEYDDELTTYGSDQKKSFKKMKKNSITVEENHKLKSPSSSMISYQFIGNLSNPNGEAFFVDGSRYRGTWDFLGMAGAGSYRMPHEVIYDGEMRDGVHHGQGSLLYPGNQIINGIWNRGDLQKWKYTFSDGLIYENDNWTYCKFPDRRFYQSVINGLNPAGKSLKTKDQPTKVIPQGCYDSGDGIFDPSTLCVTNFDHPSKIIRIPSANEIDWITKRCRKWVTEPTGYRPLQLNENWSSEPPDDLPYRLPMSNNSPEKWWKRIFTFEKDQNAILKDTRRSLKKGEDYSTSLQESGGRSGGHPECVCKSEGPDPESETTGYDVCDDLQSSEELSAIEIDTLREVVCKKMTYNYSDEEWEGEEAEDLLMTVCCPPKDEIIIRRRRESSKSLNDAKKEEQEEEQEEKEEEEEEEEEEEAKEGKSEEESESQSESEEEKLADYWEGHESRDYNYDLDDFIHDEISEEKSEKVENDFVQMIGKDLESSRQKLAVLKKRRPLVVQRPKNTQKVIKVIKNKNKRPCPPFVDTEKILQRKVGDLLFSPALDAPRSPVYLVRKDCDRKTCRKLKPKKYDVSKCGVSKSPVNLPAKKLQTRICEGDKKSLDKLRSENNNICSTSKPFITM